MTGPEHVPWRPLWVCRACGRTWPCPAARDGLRAEHKIAPVAIALLLSGYWTEAAQHLNQPADVLYQRFLGWLHEDEDEGGAA